MKNKDSSNKPLGQILIEAGLVTINQIELALQEQKHSGVRIGEILVLHGWIEQEIVNFFVEEWSQLIHEENKKPLAYYLQKAGLLDAEQVHTILRLQKQKSEKVRFHRLAVQQGYIKQITVDFFLTYLFKIYNPEAISVTRPYEILKSYTEGNKDFQKINLSESPLMSISLKEVNLEGSNLRKADLSKANLSHSSLIRVNLKQVNFYKAILTEVNFTKSCLTQANFQSAHLEKANFQSAILHEVNFQSAHLALVNFAGADLSNAKLPLDYPYDVYYDEHTSFDPEFEPKIMGWKRIAPSTIVSG